MRASTANDSKPGRRPGKASIFALMALFALVGAVQALAPASAAAMDDAGGGSEDCQWVPALPPQWLVQVCPGDEGSGGSSAGTPSGPDGGDTSGGITGAVVGVETIEVEDTLPPCLKNPSLCGPDRQGDSGRAIAESGDGTRAREPKRRGSPASAEDSKVERCQDIFEEVSNLIHRHGVLKDWAKIQEKGPGAFDPAYVGAITRTHSRIELLRERFQKEQCRRALAQGTIAINTLK